MLGRDIAVTLPLLTELVPHIGESVEDLPETLFETAPTVLFTVPRYLQKLAAQVLVQARQHLGRSSASPTTAPWPLRSGHAKRRWAGTATAACRRAGACGLERARVPARCSTRSASTSWSWWSPAARRCPPRPWRCGTCWASTSCEMYGQTETAGGIIAGQRGPFPRPGDVGTVPEGFEVKLADDGEILVRSADLFEGYWNNPEASQAVLGNDGWMRTGDVGEWRDGQPAPRRPRARFPRHLGRQDHLALLHRERAARQPLSRRGDRVRARPQVPHRPDRDRFRDGRRLGAQQRRRLHRLHQPHPAPARAGPHQGARSTRPTTQLARVEQIKAFRILPKALDPEEEGEPVTPTRKVKRKPMYERFKPLVEEMYDDKEEKLLAESATGVRWPETCKTSNQALGGRRCFANWLPPL